MINLAICGYGAWGRKLVQAVQGQSPVARFGVIVTRDPGALADAASQIGADAVGTLEQALSRGDVQGVVLATPHSLHADQVVQCAAASVPVFVEKPFALHLSEAARALDAFPPGMVVAAGFNRRFLPSVAALKQAILTGRLGDILCAEGNFSGNVVGLYRAGQWRASHAESPLGGLAGAGIHVIDLLIHLVGDVRRVAGQSSRRALDIDMDDTTTLLFELDGGAQASLVTVMASAPDFRLKLFGTNGSAELLGAQRIIWTPLDGAPEVQDFPDFNIERAEIDAFATAITGGAAFPVSRAEILNGVAAFEAAATAVQQRRWVDLP